MRPRIEITALVLCAFFGLVPASAQDLLTHPDLDHGPTGWTKGGGPPTNELDNPGFTSDLTGWTQEAGSYVVAWSSDNELGPGPSGSVKVTNLVANSSARVSADCVPVAPGERLVYGAAVAAEGGSTGARGRARLELYSMAGCAGSSGASFTDLGTFFPTSTWGAAQGTLEVPAGVASVKFELFINTGSAPPVAVYFDNAFLFKGPSCATTETTLCLAEDRFRLSATWQKPDGTKGWARVVPLTADSGYLWFFKSTNIETVVKVLDGCSFSDRFWVFAAGLTNVKVDLKVTDTLAGETWESTNPLGEAFQPVQDTDAFATCEP